MRRHCGKWCVSSKTTMSIQGERLNFYRGIANIGKKLASCHIVNGDLEEFDITLVPDYEELKKGTLIILSNIIQFVYTGERISPITCSFSWKGWYLLWSLWFWKFHKAGLNLHLASTLSTI